MFSIPQKEYLSENNCSKCKPLVSYSNWHFLKLVSTDANIDSLHKSYYLYYGVLAVKVAIQKGNYFGFEIIDIKNILE